MFNTTNNIYKLAGATTTHPLHENPGKPRVSARLTPVVLGLALFHRQITHLLKIVLPSLKVRISKYPPCVWFRG